MFRKIIVLSILFPTLTVAQPPIRDCRTFLLDMSALGYRTGVCHQNERHPLLIRLAKRQSECKATWENPTIQAESREIYRTLRDEFINDAITPETVDMILAGKQIDVSQTEFCKAYDRQLDEMARRYLQR